MDKVSVRPVADVKRVRELLTMISDVLAKYDYKSEATQASEWTGVRANIEPMQKKMFFGIYRETPKILRAEITGVLIYLHYAPDSGQIEGKKWKDQVELDSEDVHFFSRSKIGQFKYLEDFILQSIETALDLVSIDTH